jgi:membrane protein implicated in regulation of membrane protease activity
MNILSRFVNLKAKAMAFIACIVLLAMLLIAHNVFLLVSEETDLPLVARVGVQIGQDGTYFLFWLVLAVTVGYGLLTLGKRALKAIETDDEQTAETQEIQHVVENNLHGIEAALSRLGSDREEAMQRIRKAQALSGDLVRVIASAMRKYERMTDRAESFLRAIEALGGDDTTAIARTAGEVGDGQIRSLMLELLRNHDDGFRLRVQELISTQLGVVQRNAAGYRRLALQCMPQLADYKAQYERLLAVHDSYDLVEPMLLVGENLRQAQAYLELPIQEQQQIRAMPVALIESE